MDPLPSHLVLFQKCVGDFHNFPHFAMDHFYDLVQKDLVKFRQIRFEIVDDGNDRWLLNLGLYKVKNYLGMIF